MISWKRSILGIFTILVLQPDNLDARVDFIAPEGTWRFLNGDDIPTESWKETDFDDSRWKSGPAPHGYGNYQLRTYVNSEKRPRPITTFFRASFHLDDPDQWEKFLLKYKADDGMIVYLNGQKVADANMPDGEAYADTRAKKTIKHWTWWRRDELSSSDRTLLKKGKNTIAVSVHQSNPDSSDMNMRLVFTGVERGIKTKEVMDLNSDWKYNDKPRLPDNDWMAVDYDADNWKSGSGVLGYGNDDINVTLNSGSDPSNKYNCAWFRKEFTVSPEMDVRALIMKLRFDDGVVIYLNGKELQRHNLPLGYVDEHTHAQEEFNDWSNKHEHLFNHALRGLPVGKNVLAIQVHLASQSSPDLCLAMNSLELEYLKREAPVANIVRKPVPKPTTGKKPTTKPALIKVANLEQIAKAKPTEWALSSQGYREVAIRQYERNQLEAAQRALTASGWAEIFSQSGHSLEPELKLFLLAQDNLKTAQEYLDLASEHDDHYRVYEIANELFTAAPEAFRSHTNLALAIAIVYDQKPPRSWPHHQVDEAILPRKLPDPLEAFQFWVSADKGGKTLQDLDKLAIGELKYVVDTPASLGELGKAHDLRVRLTSLPELYPGIEYSMSRLRSGLYDWPFSKYTFTEIKNRGGICVDQAYYTSQIAKAHGVPAMMVVGAGSNGNHAWVGYLDGREKWDFTIGRHAEARYVTGETFDPQTWEKLSDHELSMLTERFQRSPRYLTSRLHSLFAQEYLEAGDLKKSVAAAKTALSREPRNFGAWTTLLKALKKLKTPEKELNDIYDRGARTFARSADLEAHFLKRKASSLLAAGDKSGAEKIRASIISRNRRERPDLAVQEAKVTLDALIGDASLDEQLSYYRTQTQKLKEAGLITYYALTEPFLQHLQGEGEMEAALEILDYTERRMDVEEGGQLEEAFNLWRERLE